MYNEDLRLIEAEYIKHQSNIQELIEVEANQQYNECIIEFISYILNQTNAKKCMENKRKLDLWLTLKRDLIWYVYIYNISNEVYAIIKDNIYYNKKNIDIVLDTTKQARCYVACVIYMLTKNHNEDDKNKIEMYYEELNNKFAKITHLKRLKKEIKNIINIVLTRESSHIYEINIQKDIRQLWNKICIEELKHFIYNIEQYITGYSSTNKDKNTDWINMGEKSLVVETRSKYIYKPHITLLDQLQQLNFRTDWDNIKQQIKDIYDQNQYYDYQFHDHKTIKAVKL